MTDKQFSKTAVDSVASDYWTSYYADTGYGAMWVKNLPKKVAAALDTKLAKTAARKKSAEIPTLTPFSSLVTDDGVFLEGVAKFASGETHVFAAEFAHDGSIKSFDALEVQK